MLEEPCQITQDVMGYLYEENLVLQHRMCAWQHEYASEPSTPEEHKQKKAECRHLQLDLGMKAAPDASGKIISVY